MAHAWMKSARQHGIPTRAGDCAFSDRTRDIVPVDGLGDGCAAVAYQVAESSMRAPLALRMDTNECRNSRGAHSPQPCGPGDGGELTTDCQRSSGAPSPGRRSVYQPGVTVPLEHSPLASGA